MWELCSLIEGPNHTFILSKFHPTLCENFQSINHLKAIKNLYPRKEKKIKRKTKFSLLIAI